MFHSFYDADKYKRILKTCQLKKDLKLFENGDLTIIGEKGMSLSGGQRARIGLARALYEDADILLLDDPLGAVDADVKKKILSSLLEIKNKTIVLVTHSVEVLDKVDRIIVFEKGSIIENDSFQNLSSRES